MFLPEILRFWKRFLAPYLPVLIPLIFFNMIPGVLLSMRPLVLAPVLGTVLSGDIKPAASLAEISLDNLGASLQELITGTDNDLANAFIISAALYLVISLAISVISGTVTLWSMSVRLKIFKDLIITLHEHLLNLSLAFFSKQKTGDLVSRFTNDIAKTSGSLEIVFSGLMKSLVQLLVYAFILLRSDPLLTFQILVVGSIHLIVTRILGGRVKYLTSKSYDGLASLVASLQETFQNIRLIKSFSAEDFDGDKIKHQSERVRKNHYDFMFSRYMEDPIRIFADALVISAILYISYQSICSNKMTMAGVALYFYLASQLVTPISEISRQFVNVYGVIGGSTKIIELFNYRTELIDGAIANVKFKENIVLDSIYFAYNGPNVLNHINLMINKGETIGVVGASGEGKSTLVDLILRLNDPKEGRILCDGVDIRQFKQSSYRRLFGVVSQECLLFNTTLKENILIGRSYSEEKLDRACQIANLYQFLKGLPSGLDTNVGDRGILLSGGQRQRIAIARAVYDYPEILVLDEATSALDNISEEKVKKAIANAVKDVTAIIIAHRLSTVVNADKIVVLKNGRIEAMGKHDELVKTSESYKELLKYQT